MRRSLFSQVFLTFLLLVVGVLIAVQLRVQRRLRVTSVDQDEQAVLLSELVDANSSLRAEIESLKAQREAYAHESRGAVLEELVAELNRGKAINGMVEVSGPGVELLVDGPLTALDLQDLINELRNAGAEATALNGHRWVLNSVLVVNDKEEMTMNGHSIHRPYQVRAIGDSDTMETALRRPGGVISLFRRTYSNLVVQITQHPRLVLGVHRPQLAFQYAKPVE